MDLKQRFHQVYPTAFFLEKNILAVTSYLKQQQWIDQQEKVLALEKPGEGNMNFVVRVKTDRRTFILKQARPWVEKFPQIDAPAERVAVEAQFFQHLQKVAAINSFAPTFLGFDSSNFILATQDLGQGADYSFLYQRNKALSLDEIKDLLRYLSALHQHSPPANFPSNLAMRQLNHEHIFNFPYQIENGFNLEEVQVGLQAAAIPYKTDPILKEIIRNCGAIYLAKDGACLLHGDFYPGSWLNVTNGLKVIDPEFSFVGPAEFDVGVFIAHLVLAEQPTSFIQFALTEYQQPANFNSKLLAQFAGIEILRRLIGIAQLPLSLDLASKKALMQQATQWILKETLVTK